MVIMAIAIIAAEGRLRRGRRGGLSTLNELWYILEQRIHVWVDGCSVRHVRPFTSEDP